MMMMMMMMRVEGADLRDAPLREGRRLLY